MTTNNCHNQGCVMEVIWNKSLSGWCGSSGSGIVGKIWNDRVDVKQRLEHEAKKGKVALIPEPTSIGGTVPLMGKTLSQPHGQDTRGSQVVASQDQVPHPASSTCHSPRGLAWFIRYPRHMSLPSDAEVFCKTLFALSWTSLQRPSGHCNSEGSFLCQVQVWSVAIRTVEQTGEFWAYKRQSWIYANQAEIGREWPCH